jgi:NADH-quinone oxidoreductase subunit N
MLAGWRKGDLKSNEASLKFFILGVLSTAILLWGMSMLYGITGAVDFATISDSVALIAGGSVPDFEPLLGLAILFIIVGFAFKVSAVPFHFWAPDTYEGAPTPVTAYLSVSSKAAGFVGLFVIVYVALPAAVDIWGPALWLLAAGSMTVANLAALRQENIVRLLAYSSIAQAGFMLVPFAAAAVSGGRQLAVGLEASVVYLVIYSLMNLGAFAVVIQGARRTGTGTSKAGRASARSTRASVSLSAIFFFSLAGIPPLAGWFAKFIMFQSAITAGGAPVCGWRSSPRSTPSSPSTTTPGSSRPCGSTLLRRGGGGHRRPGGIARTGDRPHCSRHRRDRLLPADRHLLRRSHPHPHRRHRRRLTRRHPPAHFLAGRRPCSCSRRE